jgi:hypothetical protein
MKAAEHSNMAIHYDRSGNVQEVLKRVPLSLYCCQYVSNS